MASDGRTEKATPKRRAEARKKGQVAKSADLNTVLVPGAPEIIVHAQGINEPGQIVGTSHDFRALLLTPVAGP